MKRTLNTTNLEASMVIKRILHQLNFGSVHEIIVVFVVVAMPFTPCADEINYDFGLLEQREYVRTNTWNGCVRYEGLGDNIFRNWKCSPNERLSAVHAARHFIKYSMAEEVPLSYYEEDVFDDHERDGLKTNTNEVLRCYRMNFNQFEPPAHGKYGVGGLDIHEMQARVLPFVVCNSTSKSALHCILVAFFQGGRFFMATYFNANTGKVVLDFHDISQSGGMLLASESRYPYLTPDECSIQGKVCADYFRKVGGVTIPSPSDLIVPPKSLTNDVEICIEDL